MEFSLLAFFEFFGLFARRLKGLKGFLSLLSQRSKDIARGIVNSEEFKVSGVGASVLSFSSSEVMRFLMNCKSFLVEVTIWLENDFLWLLAVVIGFWLIDNVRLVPSLEFSCRIDSSLSSRLFMSCSWEEEIRHLPFSGGDKIIFARQSAQK